MAFYAKVRKSDDMVVGTHTDTREGGGAVQYSRQQCTAC